MTRQLEESHDTDDAEELEDVVLLLKLRQEEVEVEGQRGDQVDHVHGCRDERSLTRTDHKADDQLEGEPRITGTFEEKEHSVWIRLSFLQHPRRSTASVVAH